MNTLVYFDGKKTDYFTDKQIEQFHKDIDKLLDNPEFVFGLIPEAKEFVEETYFYIKQLIKYPNKLLNKELSQLYKQFSFHHANYYTRMWMGFRVCQRIVMKVEGMLRNKELSTVFSIPLKPNDVTNERIDLLRIKINDGDLEKHAEKYKHIPMFDFDHEPYTVEHFKKELEKISNAEEELRKIQDSLKQRQIDFENALSLEKPDEKLYDLIMMLKKAVVFRDYRDMVRQKLNLCIRDFYKEIGKRIGLNVKEVALLTNKEIEEHLEKSIQFNKQEIEQRKNAFLLIQLDDNVKIYSGNIIKQKVAELGLYKVNKEIKIIQGVTASKGNHKGIARVINTNLDFDKLQNGEIMVAAMTRQDFVPHMRRASAIITNEGGIASHAAIIAREIGLPCIVGAKDATQVINDGDLISIDGKKGIIEILERNI